MNFLIIIAAGILLYTLIYKPEYIAVFFFTITIADINFEIGALHLNIRAVVGIALLLRTIVRANAEKYPSIFSTKVIYIYLFLLYTVLVSMEYDLVNGSFIKTISLSVISIYCAYHYFFKTGDYTYLKISLILSGLICLGDLMYTYATVGKFPVQRIYMQILHMPSEIDDQGDFVEVINHGYYGLICGLCFVFILNEFIYKRSEKISLVLMPLMFLGVLMSTSRSTLLGIIGITIYFISKQLRSREQSKKAVKLITIGIAIVFLSLFLFSAVKEVFNLNNEFLDSITGRLVDEPIAVFDKHMGFNYDAQALNALNWREEASTNAFDAYLNLNPVEQIFGIGFWGFVVRNLGRNNLPPHNGMLLLLIESGIVGLCLYMILIISILRESFRTHVSISPLVTGLIFIIIYCIGQNGELTTSTTFLFVVSLIAENKLNILHPELQDA